uniref:RNase H type-1 domain-containing protein n=1 Tax=Solanum lycopersicum TaxID=4081 RepID=A0A494GAC8_SOLLC
MALRDGLALGWSWGYKDLICEVDCSNLLTSLEDEKSVHFIFMLIFPVEIHDWLQREWIVELNGIRREINMVADHMAQMGVNCLLQEFLFLRRLTSWNF